MGDQGTGEETGGDENTHPTAKPLEQLSVSELKKELSALGVDFSECIEKDDLVRLLRATLASHDQGEDRVRLATNDEERARHRKIAEEENARRRIGKLVQKIFGNLHFLPVIEKHLGPADVLLSSDCGAHELAEQISCAMSASATNTASSWPPLEPWIRPAPGNVNALARYVFTLGFTPSRWLPTVPPVGFTVD